MRTCCRLWGVSEELRGRAVGVTYLDKPFRANEGVEAVAFGHFVVMSVIGLIVRALVGLLGYSWTEIVVGKEWKMIL